MTSKYTQKWMYFVKCHRKQFGMCCQKEIFEIFLRMIMNLIALGIEDIYEDTVLHPDNISILQLHSV